MLPKLTKLSSLSLNLKRNTITDDGSSILGDNLTKCAMLSDIKIRLSGNQIEDHGVMALG